MSGETSMVALTRTINDIGRAFEAFKEANDERLEALKNGDESRATELTAKLEKIEKDVAQFTALKKQIELEQQAHRERIEELETRASTPAKTPAQKLSAEYRERFLSWLRNKGQSAQDEQRMQDLAREAQRIRADITIGTGAAGGFAVPEEISREIGRLELLFSPVRRLVKVRPVGTSDYKELVSKRGTTSGWVGETGTRSATATPQLRERAPTFGELYAYPQVSEWSLDDIFFDIEGWLSEEVAQEFAQEEGVAVISGNGTSKPTGLVNTPPVTTADFASPERSANAFQYINSDLTPGGNGILPDALIDCQATLAAAYRARAVWVANSLTIASIRKLKDTTNQYLWQPGLQAGTPDVLLGRPVEIWENMPAIGAAAFPIALGDWQRAYVLADRVGLRITRDNVTNVGFVRFYVRRREGGHVLDNHAAKFIRTE